ncbi:MAG: hypothetical protein E6G22_14865 [Actinobacteria bacterium]|nr:MAG: hypothetical protein E6G22_14865 [Actinomycetota bacterium]
MRNLLFIVFAAAVSVLVVASTAFAKGATQATINGPGLHKGGLVLRSDNGGDPSSGSRLGELATAAGFFPAVFNQAPDPMLRVRPKGTLGPKYTVDYVMPGPNDTSSTIRQDLYPYAKPYALSYTKPGQPFWGRGQGTHGGWFLTTSAVRTTLGLPAQPPATSTGDGTGWLRWVALAITIAAGLALVGVLSLVALRRRPGPATA